MKFLNNVDLAQNELRNAVVQVLGSAPSSPKVGQEYYDSVSLAVLTWNGSSWTNKATDSALLNGQNAAYYLSRTNHTGTQLSSTISDLASTVKGYTLDQFAAPAASVAFNSKTITSLADPVNPQDGATKNYVDTAVQNAAAGIDSKPSVRVVVVANVTTLSGLQNFDGLTGASGDRVLLTAQTTASQNGPWIMASGSWTRPTSSVDTITPGAFWYVEEGTTYGKSQWRCANTGTVTIGTTSLSILQFGQAISYTNGNGLSLTGNTFAVQVVASGGILVGGSGIQVDTTIVARKYSTAIGDGSTTSYTVTHNLATQDVQITVRDTSGNVAYPDVAAATTNTVTVSFSTAPASNAYRVTVIG